MSKPWEDYPDASEKMPWEEYADDTSSPALATAKAVGDSVLFGYSPQINALLEPVVDRVTGISAENEELKKQGFKLSGQPGYVERRDANIAQLEKEGEDWPILTTAGRVAGSLAGGAGIAKALPALGAAASNAGKLEKIVRPAIAGAIQGAAINPGDTQGKVDVLQSSERLGNAGVGLTLGAAIPAAVEGVKGIAPTLAKQSNEFAVRALGPGKLSVLKKIEKFKDPEQIGQTLKDEGIITLIPKTYEKLASHIDDTLKSRGDEFGKILEEIEDAANSLTQKPGLVKSGAIPPQGKVGLSKNAVVQRLKERLLGQEELVGDEATRSRLMDLIKTFEDKTDDIIPLTKAEKLKRSYQSKVNYNRQNQLNEPVVEQFQRELASTLREGVEDTAEQVSSAIGQPGLSKQFMTLKSKLSDLYNAKEIVDDRLVRDLRNRFVSPSDYAAAMTAAAGGAGAIQTGVLGGLHNLARQYGAQPISKGLDYAAKGANKLSGPATESVMNNQAMVRQAILDQYQNNIKEPPIPEPTPEELIKERLRNKYR